MSKIDLTNLTEIQDAALTWFYENEDQFAKEDYDRQDLVCASFEACREYILNIIKKKI
jgi:hypothetical protein